jgi:ABC-type transport system substrate-binding protein
VGIIPEHAWENISSQSYKLAELNLKPIGSGPWQFESLKKNKDGSLISYTLRPFSEYHGDKAFLNNLFFKCSPFFEPIFF